MGVDPLNSNLTDLALNEKKNQNLLAMNNILQNHKSEFVNFKPLKDSSVLIRDG